MKRSGGEERVEGREEGREGEREGGRECKPHTTIERGIVHCIIDNKGANIT